MAGRQRPHDAQLWQTLPVPCWCCRHQEPEAWVNDFTFPLSTSSSPFRSAPFVTPLPFSPAGIRGDQALPSPLQIRRSLPPAPARAVPAPSTTVPESAARSTRGRLASAADPEIRDRAILAKLRTTPPATI